MPSPSPGFTIILPVAPGETGAHAFGMTPFGIHFGGTGPGGHASDGHPGWDIEYQLGASVRAAADGVIQSVVADAFAAGRSTIQIRHQAGSGAYRTVYTNIEGVAPGILAGASATRGQPLGRAGSQSQVIGTIPRTWAMTHFQVDDFSRNAGSTNPNAVNPEEFLDESGRDLFNQVWRGAGYNEELVEPFVGNPRDVPFPMTRAWTRESGSLAERLAFTRASGAASDYTYVLSFSGATERGVARFRGAAPGSTLDLESAGGAVRRGVIDIVDDTMRLALGAPGGARPSDLTGASIYRTSR